MKRLPKYKRDNGDELVVWDFNALGDNTIMGVSIRHSKPKNKSGFGRWFTSLVPKENYFTLGDWKPFEG